MYAIGATKNDVQFLDRECRIGNIGDAYALFVAEGHKPRRIQYSGSARAIWDRNSMFNIIAQLWKFRNRNGLIQPSKITITRQMEQMPALTCSRGVTGFPAPDPNRSVCTQVQLSLHWCRDRAPIKLLLIWPRWRRTRCIRVPTALFFFFFIWLIEQECAKQNIVVILVALSVAFLRQWENVACAERPYIPSAFSSHRVLWTSQQLPAMASITSAGEAGNASAATNTLPMSPANFAPLFSVENCLPI